MTIADLAAREYGGGEIRVEEMLAVTAAFTRTLITYPSDGLTIYGFINVPQGEGPFPVVLVLHGYIDPDIYTTVAYTTRYADALARAGYIAIHPNLRGFPPSDDGPDPFRTGIAVDVLNLIALVREYGGQPGLLAQADPARIGVWGHSMGGGATIRVITVDPTIQAAVLYGSMSADERQNYERILLLVGRHARARGVRYAGGRSAPHRARLPPGAHPGRGEHPSQRRRRRPCRWRGHWRCASGWKRWARRWSASPTRACRTPSVGKGICCLCSGTWISSTGISKARNNVSDRAAHEDSNKQRCDNE